MKTNQLIITVCLLSAVLWFSCDSSKNQAGEATLSQIDTAFTINIQPYPPKDLGSGAVFKEFVEFAWEEFLALNWKASYSSTGKRDAPDTTWSYTTDGAPYPALNVWETYAHRTELRPWSDKMLPFDQAPHYSFGQKAFPLKNASFKLFHNLDENNEIGSCNLFAHVKTPNDTANRVLYQAKVNRDEYEYILANYNDTASLHKATDTTKHNIKWFNAYYKGATNTCDCPPGVVCLPCGGAPDRRTKRTYTGAMEIKSAWRELKSYEDPSTFFTRKVIYYTKGIGNDTKLYYGNKTYALIGLHIIHKTKNYPSFIFATWEHMGVEQDTMKLKLISNQKTPLMTPYRDPINAITAASTRYVHSKLPKTSVWQHYRLVGVQARPTNDTTSANFYLANYVVESDRTLNHFRGSGFDNPHDGKPNLLLNRRRYSMGGCMGCHGVTQLNVGTDFSFLLATSSFLPVNKPDIGEIDQSAKLKRYILAFKTAKSAQTAPPQ